jgi:Trichohyalin-plectin-homology domain
LLREQELLRQEAARAREMYHERKMRQQVRENNQELRILESQLRTAYVSKALASQKKEREALALAEKIQEKAECEKLEKARLDHLEDLKKQSELDKERKARLHKDLTSQIITAHQQRVKIYEEFLRDKYYLDEIAQRLKEELSEQIQKKITMMEKTKKEMDAFKVIKKELERQKDIEMREENQRILEYCEQQEKKIQEEERRRSELEKNRKNLNEKMVAELTMLEVI